MISRKVEERNEKIIRGLLKLPPNRRCINCDGLGPQYVCTNFWTFVCTTCSGIHREFTHRIKSVSMAKFTTQEVEALQTGGNQRAREIFLKGWDFQNQRLPNSSNIDRIRDFIKDVYVGKKYSAGTSDKPPRNAQKTRNFEEERKASSYHSYSQSPPYDHQYEDRRYGKQSGILTRRSGSERLHYDGKLSGVACTSGHVVAHSYDDRFANDGSATRYSDYSVSSSGETLRYDVQSPNIQKSSGYSSPSPARSNSTEDDNLMTDRHKSQRTASSSSIEVGNPFSLEAVGSASLDDMKFTHTQSSDSRSMQHSDTQSMQHSDTQSMQHPDTKPSQLTESSLPSVPGSATGQTHTAKQDLFSFLSLDSMQQPSTSSTQKTSTNLTPPFIDLFAELDQPLSTNSSNQKPAQDGSLKNEGWATFDLPQHAAASLEPKNPSSNMQPINEISTVNFVSFSSDINSSTWPSVQSFAAKQHVGSVNDQLNWTPQEANLSLAPSSSEVWNPFDDSTGKSAQTLMQSFSSKTNSQVPTAESLSGMKLTEVANKYDFQKVTVNSGLPVQSPPTADGGFAIQSASYSEHFIGQANSSVDSPKKGEPSHQQKSVNPFDFPYEPEQALGNVMDMSSLRSSLPSSQFHSDFPSNVPQQVFPQSSFLPYISTEPSGSLPFIASQSSNTHFPNLSSQKHVASFGGNPFA